MAFPPRPGMVPPPGMLHAPPPGMPVYGMIPIPPGAPPPSMVPPGSGPPRFPPNMPGQPFRPNHMQRPPPDIVAPPVAPAGSPAVTVFVGNITERAQDGMVRHLLNTCGPVLSWKRVQGATGKLQAFGFCEYGNPDAALRAIRILHDWEVGDKKLVVKVDAKTKDVLDDYRNKRIRAITGKSPPINDGKEGNDKQDAIFMDADVKHEDRMTQDRIRAILHDHDQEMANYIPPEKKKVKKQPYSNIGPDGEVVRTGPKESLDDVEMEDGKRDIIHREIDKFRETMLIREKEKEEEKKKSEVKDSKDDGSKDEKRDKRKERDRNSREIGSRRSHKKSASRSKSKEGSPGPVIIGTKFRDQRSRSRRNRSRSKDRSRSMEKERELRERERVREREREREKEKERERETEREYERERRERSRERERNRRDKTPKEIWKEQDTEDEERDRKKAERKARDKETSYQERLRKWELREQRMNAEYKKDKLKEVKRLEDIEREAKKLREFLEDYDDDRDDDKYYKNEKLDRRMNDREREAMRDAEDRRLEREEIEELRAQIVKEGHGDPNAELERRMTLQGAMDNAVRTSNGLLNPIPSSVLAGQSTNQNGLHHRLQPSTAGGRSISNEVEIIEPDIVHLSPPPRRVPLPIGVPSRTEVYGDVPPPPVDPFISQHSANDTSSTHSTNNAAATYAQNSEVNQDQDNSEIYNNRDCDDDHDGDYQDAPPSPEDQTSPHHNSSPAKNTSTSGFKPIGVPSISLMPVPAPSTKTVVAKEEGGITTKPTTSVSSGRKKMDVKDVFNQDDDETPSHVNKRNRKGVPSPTKKVSSKDANKMSSEEKRKHIKSLIEKIPTDKTALFEYPIDWDLVDNPLMEKRIRPWVNKKISEYIGEPEPTLTDFICSKVLAGSRPDAVLEDVRMVLDEEADVFVVKMWRLLIYEIESKKFKAAAGTDNTGSAGAGSTTTTGGNSNT